MRDDLTTHRSHGGFIRASLALVLTRFTRASSNLKPSRMCVIPSRSPPSQTTAIRRCPRIRLYHAPSQCHYCEALFTAMLSYALLQHCCVGQSESSSDIIAP
ncbi:hypothetical protein OH76DRAFT_1021177 [Lentinus brumalis]|uniref:Uncharacterized protein n=1 Tax=Lentinus brumalis TaxID=2498619 RepID=A0A371CXW3_9APHY|nr:hypothetical protein OH76DRAFT_1021177 [Polyporus brumalis]